MTRSPIARSLATALALAAAGGFASALPAQGVPSDSLFSGFQSTGDYLLEVDGVDQPKAEIYYSDNARSLLVIASAFPSPVLINVPAKSVETLDLMKVAKQPNGDIDLLADAVLAPQGTFQIAAQELAFAVAGKTAKLKQRPFLLGLHSSDELLAHSPEYARLFKQYQPDPDTMKALKSQREPVRVRVFFGSWCPFCKRHVPLILKVAEGLKGTKFAFEYFGVPHDFDKDPEALKFGVLQLPTGILYVGDKEIGRIPVADWSSPEVGMKLLLEKVAK